MKNTKHKNAILNREHWLEGGLKALSEKGLAGLLTEPLAKSLGVTTGSFYWHFQGREDFFNQLLGYWSSQMTQYLIEDMDQTHLSPKDKLIETFMRINDQQLARYETPVRAWALTNKTAKEVVTNIDNLRLDYIRKLFLNIGMDGDQLEMRARTLLMCATTERSIFLNDDSQDSRRWLKLRLELMMQ